MSLIPTRLVTMQDSSHTRRAKYSHGTDTIAVMQAAGYFNEAHASLPKGTVVELVGSIDATPQTATGVVTASSAAGVTIAIGEASSGAGVAGSSFLLSARGISSKASDAAVARFPAPFKGRIVRLDTVINGQLATGDATVTLAIAGNAVTGGVATIAQPGAVGDVDTATPTAANTFTQGQLITATVGGASSATATLDLQIVVEETA